MCEDVSPHTEESKEVPNHHTETTNMPLYSAHDTSVGGLEIKKSDGSQKAVADVPSNEDVLLQTEASMLIPINFWRQRTRSIVPHTTRLLGI